MPLLLLLLLLTLGSAASLSAQTLEGRVLDGGTQEPISDALVTLLHPDGRALAEPDTTGDDGTFQLSLPGVGEYYLRIERTSYTPIVDGIFEFTRPDGHMKIDIFLLPRPVELEGVEVRVQQEQVRRKLRAAGFYQRATTGFGNFVTPEEIERQGP